MTNVIVDVADKDALALLLRSKTALGRLNDDEVHSVLAFLEGIGFKHQAASVAPAPAAPIVSAAPPPAPVVPAVPLVPVAPIELAPAPVVVPVLPAAPSILASLEAAIEKDVEAIFEHTPPAPVAPIAPPPAQ